MSTEYLGAAPLFGSRMGRGAPATPAPGRYVNLPAGTASRVRRVKKVRPAKGRPTVRRIVGVPPRPILRSFTVPPSMVTQTIDGYNDALGFSLKPPKWARKAVKSIKRAVTLKNVLKVGAVVGAASLIPGALPLVAKGAVGAGKLALGAGKLAVKGGSVLARFAGKNISQAAKILLPGPTQTTVPAEAPPLELPAGATPPILEPRGEVPPVVLPAPEAVPYSPPTVYSGGGGAAAATPEEAVSQAGVGTGANMMPLIIGGAAVVGAMMLTRRR